MALGAAERVDRPHRLARVRDEDLGEQVLDAPRDRRVRVHDARDELRERRVPSRFSSRRPTL